MSQPTDRTRFRRLWPWALALLIWAAASAFRLTLFPLGGRLAYGAFYPAVVAALYFCGVGPGLLVTVLSALVAVYYLTPPYGAWGMDGAGLLGLLFFVATAVACAAAIHRLRRLGDELKRAQEVSEQSRRELAATVNDQTEMVFRFDARGHLLMANPAARSAFQLAEQDLRARTWHCLVEPEDRSAVDAQLAQMTPDHPVVKTESRYPGADGAVRWGEFVHHALYDELGRLQVVQTVGRDITEARQLKVQVSDLAASLLDFYDHAPCAYYSVDAQGVFCQVNAVLQAWLGCTADELVGHLGPRDFMSTDGAQQYAVQFPSLVEKGALGPLEYEIRGRQGAVRKVSVTATAVRDDQGHFLRSRSVMYDISELDRVRKELTALARQQALMLDNDLISILRLRERRIVWSNRASERMFGYGPGELLGQSARVLYSCDADYEAWGKVAYPQLRAGGHFRAQQSLVRRDGSPIWVDVSGVQLSAETGEAMWMALDITEMKQHQAQVEHVAFHDGLTGLPNRMLLMDRLHLAIQLGLRSGECLGVCYIDLDGFKPINDRLGHAAGDEVLREVARRLHDGMRGHDTAARVGGDEFVLLLPKLQDRAEGERILRRLTAEVAEPLRLSSGETVAVGASAGLACCPEDGTSEDALLRRADQAMYDDKVAKRR